MSVTNISIKSPTGQKYDTHPALTGVNAQQNKAALAGLIADLSLMVLSGGSTSGVGNSDVDFQSSGTRASATYTLNAVVATNTITVNGVVLTGIASGATAAQFNIGATDAATAQNIVATINSQTAPAGILGVVRAWCAPGSVVVTVECIYPGTIGNSITTVGTVTRFTVSGATMSGGVVGGILRPYLP